jgi:hypothetical protein
MKNNEKKILIVAVCCIAIIGLTAYFFTETSTAARKGTGQGRAFASQCNPGQQGSGWNRQNANCPGDCSGEAENCSGDCDNCDEDQKNFKNRTLENEVQSDKDGSGQGIWMFSQETQGQGFQQGSGQNAGRQGRGCSGSVGCCP